VPYFPLYKNTFYKKLNLHEANCPNTEAFFSSMTSLPFHHHMPANEFEYLINSTKETLNEL